MKFGKAIHLTFSCSNIKSQWLCNFYMKISHLIHWTIKTFLEFLDIDPSNHAYFNIRVSKFNLLDCLFFKTKVGLNSVLSLDSPLIYSFLSLFFLGLFLPLILHRTQISAIPSLLQRRPPTPPSPLCCFFIFNLLFLLPFSPSSSSLATSIAVAASARSCSCFNCNCYCSCFFGWRKRTEGTKEAEEGRREERKKKKRRNILTEYSYLN